MRRPLLDGSRGQPLPAVYRGWETCRAPHGSCWPVGGGTVPGTASGRQQGLRRTPARPAPAGSGPARPCPTPHRMRGRTGRGNRQSAAAGPAAACGCCVPGQPAASSEGGPAAQCASPPGDTDGGPPADHDADTTGAPHDPPPWRRPRSRPSARHAGGEPVQNRLHRRRPGPATAPAHQHPRLAQLECHTTSSPAPHETRPMPADDRVAPTRLLGSAAAAAPLTSSAWLIPSARTYYGSARDFALSALEAHHAGNHRRFRSTPEQPWGTWPRHARPSGRPRC